MYLNLELPSFIAFGKDFKLSCSQFGQKKTKKNGTLLTFDLKSS